MSTPAIPAGASQPNTGITPRAAWGILAFLWIAYVLNYVDRQVVFSIFPVLRAELGFSDAQLGLIGTMFLWVYSLCMPVTGRIADVLRRDRIIITSLVLWSLATLGTGLSTSATSLLAWRAVVGVTESLYVPAALATIAMLHPGSTRSKALAIHSSAQFTGIIGGGWYGGWAAEHVGWRPGFALLALAGIAYALVLWRVFRKMPHMGGPKQRRAATPAAIFKSRCYLALAAAFFAFCTMLWTLYAWFPNFIYERYHLSMTQSGLIATLYLQISCAAGVLTGGVLSDWMVKRIPSARFLIAVCGLAGCTPFAFLSSAADSLTGAKLASAAFGFIAGVYIANIFAAAYDVISKQNYGLGAGLLNLTGGLSGGAAILAAGVWKESVGIVTLLKWEAIASAAGAFLLLAVVLNRFTRERRSALAAEESS